MVSFGFSYPFQENIVSILLFLKFDELDKGFLLKIECNWLLFLKNSFSVIEHAYQLANATQKQELLMELYSTELQLFKDL
jgi:hypothetical protein